MNILHIVPSYLPAVRYGGPIVSVHGLCRALARAGHRVDVFTTLVDGNRDMPIEPGTRHDIDGVGVFYFAVSAPRRWYYSRDLAAALQAQIHDYDVVHLHALFLHPVSAGAHAAGAAKVPYIISPRGMLVRSLFEQRSQWLKTAWMALLGRRVLERAAVVHVTSEAERADINAFNLHYAGVVEIPNGIDLVQSTTASPAREPDLVLFLGRLSWKKQIDRLLSAMLACPRLRLAIVGNDEENLLPTLQSQAQELGITDRVQFTGPVQAAQRDAWYARAAMFVLPSRSENFANTVLEAMAGACPVIVTPAVGLSSVVQSSGCGIVCEDNVDALAAAMRRLADEPDSARQMGVRGQQVVRQSYLWPMVAARMARLYTDVSRGDFTDAA